MSGLLRVSGTQRQAVSPVGVSSITRPISPLEASEQATCPRNLPKDTSCLTRGPQVLVSLYEHSGLSPGVCELSLISVFGGAFCPRLCVYKGRGAFSVLESTPCGAARITMQGTQHGGKFVSAWVQVCLVCQHLHRPPKPPTSAQDFWQGS